MDIQEAAAAGFEGCEREDLLAFCDMLNVEYLPNHNNATLKKRLIAACSEYQEYAVDDTDVVDETEKLQLPPAQNADGGLTLEQLAELNLTQQGVWGGRRRLVTLHRAMEHQSTAPQFFAWGQMHVYLPFGTGPHAIPYPIFNILVQAQSGQRLVRKRRVDEDGRVYYVDDWIPSQRFMFTDHGDDPGTAHLPTDLQDQHRRMWEMTKGFDGYSKMQFRELCRRLRIPIGPDITVTDMRILIGQTLGVRVNSLGMPAAGIPRKGD